MAVAPLVAGRIVTRRPSAANSPRSWAMYSPAESMAGTAATIQVGLLQPARGGRAASAAAAARGEQAQTDERGQPGEGPPPEKT